MNAAGRGFWPRESNLTGPCTLLSVTPLCRYWMILALFVPRVAVTASAATSPTEYASATSALIPEAVPPYLAMYSWTITWLSGFLYLPYQPLGTMIPVALPVLTALRKAWPWSGPDAAMKIFGL